MKTAEIKPLKSLIAKLREALSHHQQAPAFVAERAGAVKEFEATLDPEDETGLKTYRILCDKLRIAESLQERAKNVLSRLVPQGREAIENMVADFSQAAELERENEVGKLADSLRHHFPAAGQAEHLAEQSAALSVIPSPKMDPRPLFGGRSYVEESSNSIVGDAQMVADALEGLIATYEDWVKRGNRFFKA